ncbi:MAG: hypothetical protein LBH36_01270 [Candidatus Nomurabacteria bacterium]|nr:hypothetical protein [Candidatus Nomurabacteria bacterium]
MNSFSSSSLWLPVEIRSFLTSDSLRLVNLYQEIDMLVDDDYNDMNGITVSAEEFKGGTHNPLYDSAAAAAYRKVRGW